MAIKLKAKEIGQRDDLAGALREAIESFQIEQGKAENWIENNPGEDNLPPEIKEGLNMGAAKLLVAIEEAENFRAELAERFREEYDGKSDKWMESETGEAADAFINEWESCEFETLDISGDLVTAEFDESMPDTLEGLPDAPE